MAPRSDSGQREARQDQKPRAGSADGDSLLKTRFRWVFQLCPLLGRDKMKPALKLKIFLALIPFSLLSLTISPAAPVNAVIASQTQTGASEQPALDRLVDVGGYRLYVKCIGSGSPTVILEAGLGGGSDDWEKIMPDVGKFARVCSYDRPHEGKSDPIPRTLRRFGSHTYIELRAGQQIVQDLHTLLAKAGVSGPYVLVGHSLGGLYAILYANKYRI